MPTYQKCDASVSKMAAELLKEYETHVITLNGKVAIDFVFAYGDRDESGLIISPALKLHGNRALGICRKIGLKDRALGRGDAEIALDGDWWATALEEEQRALLDHELHHIAVKVDKRGIVTDDLGRPVIGMRMHDVQVGFFDVIAERHGKHSQERIQARQIFETRGQFYWPELVPKLVTAGKK